MVYLKATICKLVKTMNSNPLQIVIDLLLPSPIIFSALTVTRYKESHDTLSKDTLVSKDSVIDEVKL